MSTITTERVAEFIKNPLDNDLTRGEQMELARIALASLEAEPVGEFYEDGPLNWYQISDGGKVPDSRRIPLYRHAQPAKGLDLAGWQFKSVNGDWLGLIDEHGKNQAVREGCEVREVFAMADGVNERDQVRSEHAEWSQATFGNVGPVGPLKHLSKEALEAAAEPGDLSEWADMQFLLWDAQRRAGISDEQITQAMIEKLAVNKQREWPEPKDGEPRLHIKESGNSPVIPYCWCHTCRPVDFTDSRFVVCPECGNKRCPHANDHRNACTGSNEPGQKGSACPAAPQQEV